MHPLSAALRPLGAALALSCLALSCLALGALALWCSPARADEIIVRDLDTGAESSIRAWKVTSESWSEIKYKERERSADRTISPALRVVRIRHSQRSKEAEDLDAAIAELGRKNYREAADALQAISGGGYKTDLETGDRKYVSFSEHDPKGRNKRPPWLSEYSHFYYAQAKYLEGRSKKDRDLLQEALLAIDDLPVPDGEAGQTTGGFLGRFANGNSRFYPDAMAIKANLLVALARYDDAAALFTALHNASIRVPLDPRWSYEGLIGAGTIAEAQGDATSSIEAYNAAATTMKLLLREEARGWMLNQYGRYYSQARMHAAAVMLQTAEKRKAVSAFNKLRAWIKGGQPETLRAQAGGLPKKAVDALVAGAREPTVQAVGLNGIGLAYLNEPKPKYEEALLAFKAVTVKYFQVPEQHARALYYLAKAAKGAAAQAKGEARSMYEGMVEQARTMLRGQHPNSPWANR